MDRVHSSGSAVVIPSSADLQQWRTSGQYLPEFMRDFHDQKDLFKAMDEVVVRYNTRSGRGYDDLTLSWIDAHKYTVDIFLWVLANHGYTLQRARRRFPFSDINEFIGAARRRALQASSALLNAAFRQATTPASPSLGGDERQRVRQNQPVNPNVTQEGEQ